MRELEWVHGRQIEKYNCIKWIKTIVVIQILFQQGSDSRTAYLELGKLRLENGNANVATIAEKKE